MPGHPAALYNRGNALSALGRTQEALAAFDCALAAAPNHVQAWNNRGRALQALNRHADAVASFDKAIALQKDYADANFNRALSLLTLGDLSGGFAQYEWRWKRSGMSDTRRATASRSGSANTRSPAKPFCCTPNKAWATPSSSPVMRRCWRAPARPSCSKCSRN